MKNVLIAPIAGLALLTACNPEQVAEAAKNASLATAKALGIEIVKGLAVGDPAIKGRAVSFLEGYCDQVSGDARAVAREWLSIDQEPAVTVNCGVVAALAAARVN